MQSGGRQKDSISLLLPTFTLLYFHIPFFSLSKGTINVLLRRKINLLLANKYDSSRGENSHYSFNTKLRLRKDCLYRSSFVSNIQSVGIFRSAENVLIKLSNLVKTCTASGFTITSDPSFSCQQFANPIVRESLLC